jgi:hypothetical protein
MGDQNTIRLEYGLDTKELTYSGTITVEQPGSYASEDFDGYTFARMMARVATHVRKLISVFGDARVILSRTGLANSEYLLDSQTVELLNVDPAAAISSMSHPDTVVHVRDEMTSDRPGLKVGHATLAASFGDEVYCAYTRGELECPGCGRWSSLANGFIITTFTCQHCSFQTIGVTQGPWFVVDVKQLLLSPALATRSFYLPRKWNTGGPWIHSSDLQERYETFLRERSQCK